MNNWLLYFNQVGEGLADNFSIKRPFLNAEQ